MSQCRTQTLKVRCGTRGIPSLSPINSLEVCRTQAATACRSNCLWTVVHSAMRKGVSPHFTWAHLEHFPSRPGF